MYETVFQILEKVDPNYKSEKAQFLDAVMHLQNLVQDDRRRLLDDVLRAEECRMNINLAYLAWLGLFQNYSCFMDNSQCDFLNMEFEELHTEEYMNTFFEARNFEARNLETLSHELQQGLSESEEDYLYLVTSYYCYLETVAYKYAHYAGFCLGNILLPRVVPGYHENRHLTDAYTQMLSAYFDR